MIRLATIEDMPYLLKMVEAYHSLSPFKGLEYSKDKVEATLSNLIPSTPNSLCIVQVDDLGIPRGLLVAVAQEMLFGPTRQAVELIWFVEPEFRGKESFKLLEAYEYWAKEVSQSKIAILSTLDQGLEKVYEVRGYHVCERAFMKDLQDNASNI